MARRLSKLSTHHGDTEARRKPKTLETQRNRGSGGTGKNARNIEVAKKSKLKNQKPYRGLTRMHADKSQG
jgi:hypothetical protein